ncbi:VOC family protein [Halorubrum tibetense]|uniref:VOC family protein n=1 Tax=Halorubrum tibetense TaxID=175631 RepID=A0ABD5SCL1_9EURY
MSDPTAHHVGVTVSDLDRAVDFYTNAFGFEVVTEFSVGGEAFAAAVDVDGATAEFAHLDAGDTVLELVEYDPAGPSTAAPELNGTGTVHVGLAVDDVEACYTDLDDAVETLSPPRTTDTGTTVLFCRDPDGNLIELLDG